MHVAGSCDVSRNCQINKLHYYLLWPCTCSKERGIHIRTDSIDLGGLRGDGFFFRARGASPRDRRVHSR